MHSIFERRTIVSAAAVMCLCLAGCNDNKAMAPKAPEVRFMEISGESVTLTRELPGRVTALQVSEVRPQVGGIIKERLFEEGSDVKAGQVLYTIDPAMYQAAYDNARAEVSRAEANLASARSLAQRYAKIVKTNSISKQDYDEAVAAHRQAAAAVESARQTMRTAKINLDYTKVTAPVSGRIGRSFVTPGALATQNQAEPLARIQQLGSVYVDVTQSNTEVLKLRRALAAGRLKSSGPDSANVKLLLEDGSPYASNMTDVEKGAEPAWIEGTLLFSDVTIDQSTGAVTLRAAVENPHNILLPGMYVRAVIEEGVKEDAVLIPQKTVMRDNRGEPYVYVLQKQGKDGEKLADTEYVVARRPVTLDRDYHNQWLVTKGLQMGDVVLVDGIQKARPGTVVSGTRVDTTNFASHKGTQLGMRR